jgi:hypothetical protein
MTFRKAAGFSLLIGLAAVLLYEIAQSVGYDRFLGVGGPLVAILATLVLAIYLIAP